MPINMPAPLKLLVLHLSFTGLLIAADPGVENPAPAPASTTEGRSLEVEGVIVPFEEVKLASGTQGVIVETFIHEGETVSRNAPLAQVSDAEQKIEVETTRMMAQKRLADFKSFKKLYDEKIASRDDFEKAALEAQIALATNSLAEMRLKNKTIRSPIDGILVRRLKNRGEALQNMEPFAEIVNIDKVWLILYVDAKYIGQVERGAQIDVVVPALDNRNFQGRVEMVDPVIDPGANIFRVKVLLDNAQHAIKSGIRGTAKLKLTRSDS